MHKSKRILLIMSCYEREAIIASLIEDELKNNAPEVVVKVVFWNRGANKVEMIAFAPDCILTFPPTLLELIESVALLKSIFRCRVFAFVTEGIPPAKDNNKKYIDFFGGPYKYPQELYDGWCVWGQEYKKSLHFNHVNIVGVDIPIYVFGYPLWEYEHIERIKSGNFEMPEFVALSHKYKKTILVLSGFPEANKSEDDFRASTDAYDCRSDNVEIAISELRMTASRIRDFRDRYYSTIKKIALENRDMLFVIKLHPIEHEQLSHNRNLGTGFFEGINNIIVMRENIPLCYFYRYIDGMIHYKSTLGWEAYMNQIPAVYFESDDEVINNWAVAGIVPGVGYAIDEKDRILENFKTDMSSFCRTDIDDQGLADFFNYSREKKYEPSHELAVFLNNNCFRYRGPLRSVYSATKLGYKDKIWDIVHLLIRFKFLTVGRYVAFVLKSFVSRNSSKSSNNCCGN